MALLNSGSLHIVSEIKVSSSWHSAVPQDTLVPRGGLDTHSRLPAFLLKLRKSEDEVGIVPCVGFELPISAWVV